MREKILTNIRIIDPSQKMDEIGNIIINDKGKIKSIGKSVKSSDASKTADKIDLKGNINPCLSFGLNCNINYQITIFNWRVLGNT